MPIAIKLSHLKNGQSSTISQILLPSTETDRLSVMGIYIGKKIIKKHAQPLGGPVSVQMDGSIVALSSRLAAKIMVQPDE
ncbi:MAG: FeoA domain-containing protein [Chloroflexi bacterium]|nr:FeoA domain-containing protein [Chloroflexota bacterium]